MTGDVLLSATESICPECIRKLEAQRVMRGDDVILRRECPDHGLFETAIWRGDPFFGFWQHPKTPAYPKAPFTSAEKGCPWDCGLCPEHRQHTCTALIEVTQRCNLRCAFCFANAGTGDSKDPGLHTIKLWYERLLSAGGPYNIQLSGGEPTLREDLPEIVALGRSLGFSFIQVNTNGLRLAERKSYAKELKDAGAASIFLQFDGVEDPTYKNLRGRPLLHEKKLAVQHCAEHGLGVVLVPTLVPGINIHEIGAILRAFFSCSSGRPLRFLYVGSSTPSNCRKIEVARGGFGFFAYDYALQAEGRWCSLDEGKARRAARATISGRCLP